MMKFISITVSFLSIHSAADADAGCAGSGCEHGLPVSFIQNKVLQIGERDALDGDLSIDSTLVDTQAPNTSENSTAKPHATCPDAEHDNCCSCVSDEVQYGDWDNGRCCGTCTNVCDAEQVGDKPLEDSACVRPDGTVVAPDGETCNDDEFTCDGWAFNNPQGNKVLFRDCCPSRCGMQAAIRAGLSPAQAVKAAAEAAQRAALKAGLSPKAIKAAADDAVEKIAGKSPMEARKAAADAVQAAADAVMKIAGKAKGKGKGKNKENSTAKPHASCPDAEHDNCCSCVSDEVQYGDWDNGRCCGTCTNVCDAEQAGDNGTHGEGEDSACVRPDGTVVAPDGETCNDDEFTCDGWAFNNPQGNKVLFRDCCPSRCGMQGGNFSLA